MYANQHGELCDFPDLEMAGKSGFCFFRPKLTDLIPLPKGSELFVLKDRYPVGYVPGDSEPVHLEETPDMPGQVLHAVAAFMAPAHTAIYTAAFEKSVTGIKHLPLFAYTAVGWLDGRFWVAGFRSDSDQRQEPGRFSQEQIKMKTARRLQKFPANRLVQHLGKCSLTYGCPAAVNFFMDRWEAPLPVSPTCNARCIGCISLQPSGCCPATQDRIKFVPTPEEIAEIAIGHLQRTTSGVVSFGQGCEGEPLTEAETIGKAIRLIRSQTKTGTVNLNSNSSRPRAIKELIAAGLDSLRVSMNSAQAGYHNRYYRPKGFTFADVKNSIRIMKDAGKFVSLNYFILPGFTDDPTEFASLCELMDTCRPDFIQLRNLNMDPDWYLSAIEFSPSGEAMTIPKWLSMLRAKHPNLGFGYFNPPLR